AAPRPSGRRRCVAPRAKSESFRSHTLRSHTAAITYRFLQSPFFRIMFSQWPEGGTTLGKAQAWLMVWMAATAGAQAASLRAGLLGKLPLRFEENRGAGAHREAKYTARGPNFVLSLAPGQNWLEWRDGSPRPPAPPPPPIIQPRPPPPQGA